MKIASRDIGPKCPVFIIAELSANHNGSFAEASNLVKAAKDCGADAVKLQTYTASTLTIQCDRPEFRLVTGTLWVGRTLHEKRARSVRLKLDSVRTTILRCFHELARFNKGPIVVRR